VPRGAAITVVALVLAATIVTGGERTPANEAGPRSTQPDPVIEPADDLDMEALVRRRNEAGAQDLFARHSWIPPQAALAPREPAVPAPPPPPEPPVLPFKYLGRMVKPDATLIYLLRNQDMVVTQEGARLDGAYEIEQVSDTQIVFVYLPLNRKQTLAVTLP
jgi:hypothetical protein